VGLLSLDRIGRLKIEIRQLFDFPEIQIQVKESQTHTKGV